MFTRINLRSTMSERTIKKTLVATRPEFNFQSEIIKILTEARPEFNFQSEAIRFIEKGMLDSFDIIFIISEIEEKFDILIDGDQILPENLNSIEAISKLITRFS